MGTIRAEGIGKYYKRYTNRWSRLAEWLDPDEIVRHEKHWVLHDVNFEIRAGESVGIIGQNGAGKSTLLKIITGTTQPSTGRVRVDGRVAALLELGMGFHPDFTGRQNAYMSGQLLGYSTEEVSARIGEIESFAEIGDYIDQPMRTYSSGMQVRLAFSVATCIRPDILIVDEALSVGDIYFQQKCFERIQGFAAAGTTLLFVSHATSTVLNLCGRAILLKDGRVAFDGDPKPALDLYQASLLLRVDKKPGQLRLEPARAALPEQAQDGADEANGSRRAELAELANTAAAEPGSIRTAVVEFVSARLMRTDGHETTVLIGDSDAVLEITYVLHERVDAPAVGFKFRNAYGVVLYETNSYCMNLKIGALAIGVPQKFRFAFRARFAPGEYTVTVGFGDRGYGDGSFDRALNYQHGVMAFSVTQNLHGPRWTGLVNLEAKLEPPDSPLAD